MTDERMVKGSVLADIAALVQQMKDLPWDQYLTDEDFEIVNSLIIPTNWYPIGAYQRIGNAVFELIAQNDSGRARAFGVAAMTELYNGPYRSFLEKNDPHEALQKFLDLRTKMFNYGNMLYEQTGATSGRITLSELGSYNGDVDVFGHYTGAHFTELIKLNGGGEPTVESKTVVKGLDTNFVFDLEWK